MFGRNVSQQQTLPVVETMEARRMLSATVVDGTLMVSGTSDSDVIQFSLNARGDQVKVAVNGDVTKFDIADLVRVSASGRGGHDKIRMSDKYGDVLLKARFS